MRIKCIRNGFLVARRNKIILRIIITQHTCWLQHIYSQVYSSLKRKGQPIPTNDMWIAAQALENGCVVCTHDKNFSHIDGLIAADSLEELSAV